jgi:hypothetical protein
LVRYLRCFGKGFFLKRDDDLSEAEKQEKKAKAKFLDKKALLEEEYEQSAVVPIKMFEDAFRDNA